MVNEDRKIKITCDAANAMPIDDLEAFQGKLKSISEVEFEKLKSAILKYGFSFPVFVWRKNILDGHQRVQAVKRLIDDGYELEGGMLPVVLIEAKDRKEAAEKLLLINSRYATIDQDGFDWFVQDFDIDVVDMSGLLEIPEIDFGIEDDEEFEGNTDPDDVPEVEETPVTKMGDIWLLGKHRLCCGDSTKIEDVERLMGGEKADMVFCDPPYGVSYADKNAMLNSIAPANRIQTEIENDHKTVIEMKEFWKKLFSALHFAASDKASYYLTGPQGGELMMMMMMSIIDAGWQLKHMIIWVKNNHVLGRCDYHYKHEPILYGWKNRETHNFYGSSSEFSVWNIDKPLKSDLHPTMKPVELVSKAIKNSSKDNDIIIDFCNGSGTTIIAAQQTGRKCYAMEISPQYVDVAVKRWQDFTGKAAVLERTEETFEMIKNAVTS